MHKCLFSIFFIYLLVLGKDFMYGAICRLEVCSLSFPNIQFHCVQGFKLFFQICLHLGVRFICPSILIS